MKIDVYFTKSFTDNYGSVEQQVVSGIVKTVFSQYTEDELRYMWHELKATAALHIHDKHATMLKLYMGILDAVDEIFDDNFMPDEFAVKFEDEKGRFFLSFGSGIEQFGFDEKTEDWNWNCAEVYLKSRDPEIICEKINEKLKERAENMTEEEHEKANEAFERLERWINGESDDEE